MKTDIVRGLNQFIIMKATSMSAQDGNAEAVSQDPRGISPGDKIIFLPGSYTTFTVGDNLYIAVPGDNLIATVRDAESQAG